MKTLSKILYVAYSILLIFILVADTGIATVAIDWAKAALAERKDIADVSVQLDEDELLAGRYYTPKYIPTGDFTGDAGLEFTSMNPEYLTVSFVGAVIAKTTFEGDSLDASIKITSKYDKDFEKIVTFRFVKKYPENVNVAYYMNGYGYSAKTLYTGVPVYAYSNISTQNPPYNMTDYTLVYDEEYFDKTEDGALIPKRETVDGETLTFKAVYGNGMTVESVSFVIKAPDNAITDVDEIRVNNSLDDSIDLSRGSPILVYLYYKGKHVASDYSIAFTNEDGLAMNKAGMYYFKTPGDRSVTITLPNGLSKTVLLRVRNVISAPIIEDEEINQSRYITISDNSNRVVNYSFENEVTYKTLVLEYDKEIIRLTQGSSRLVITPLKAGTTTVKLIVDDGVDRFEESFTVEVKADNSIRVRLIKTVSYWLPKLFGHGGLFLLLAFFAMNMFKHLDVDGLFARFLLYSMSGLSVAFISEFMQMFMPLRSASMADIAIDMGGFLLGTLLVLLKRSIKGE